MSEQIAASPSSDVASVKQKSYEMQYYDALADEHQTASPQQTVRSKVIQTLHAMMHERLFGNRPWLADSETAWAVNRKLKGLGLNEPVPGELNTERATPLGREVNIDLMQVFMGVWVPYEMPFILGELGLLTEHEIFEVEERLYEDGEDPEPVLLPLVRRAFF